MSSKFCVPDVVGGIHRQIDGYKCADDESAESAVKSLVWRMCKAYPPQTNEARAAHYGNGVLLGSVVQLARTFHPNRGGTKSFKEILASPETQKHLYTPASKAEQSAAERMHDSYGFYAGAMFEQPAKVVEQSGGYFSYQADDLETLEMSAEERNSKGRGPCPYGAERLANTAVRIAGKMDELGILQELLHTGINDGEA